MRWNFAYSWTLVGVTPPPGAEMSKIRYMCPLWEVDFGEIKKVGTGVRNAGPFVLGLRKCESTYVGDFRFICVTIKL